MHLAERSGEGLGGCLDVDSGGTERILETLSALIKTREDRAAFPREVVARFSLSRGGTRI